MYIKSSHCTQEIYKVLTHQLYLNKSGRRDYILYDSIYLAFLKITALTEWKWISAFRVLEVQPGDDYKARGEAGFGEMY